MVSQGVLPFQYELESEGRGMTAFAGLPTWLDLAAVSGLRRSIEAHVGLCNSGQGWSDAQIVLALLLLNLVGGDCVDDIDKLEADDGLREIVAQTECHGMTRAERREFMWRFRKSRERVFPSASVVRRYLERFDDPEGSASRGVGSAYIPPRTNGLRGLLAVLADQLRFKQAQYSRRVATLDQDATLIETHKHDATFCYKGFRAFQPLTTWWAEHRVVVHTELRDGNVPAGFDQLRALEEALEQLPDGIEQVRLRSDSAGHQNELLRYCADGRNERFGVIEFSVSIKISDAFHIAVSELSDDDWVSIDDKGRQWAEVCFAPDGLGTTKSGPRYRFIAVREPLRQLDLPGVEPAKLPFPTYANGASRYKLHGIVTNRDIDGAKLVRWHHERCGDSEAAHSVMKSDLAGGQMPSARFGANAAWWLIVAIALNLNAIMKDHVLEPFWAPKRMKALRFGLLCIAGRVLRHARQLIIRISARHPAAVLLCEARRRIAALVAPAPS